MTLELFKVNELFRCQIGINVISYFFISTAVIFSTFTTGIELRFALLTSTVFVYIQIVYIPFCWSSKVIDQINATKKLFQNLAFNSKTNLTNKKRINYISFYTANEKIGFTCFDLFILNSCLGLTMSLQIIVYIMMLVKISP